MSALGGKRTLPSHDPSPDFQILDRNGICVESTYSGAHCASAYNIYLQGLSLGSGWHNPLPQLVAQDEARASGPGPKVTGDALAPAFEKVILLKPYDPNTSGHHGLRKWKTGDKYCGLSLGAILFEAPCHALQGQLGAVERLFSLASTDCQQTRQERNRAHVDIVTIRYDVRNGSEAAIRLTAGMGGKQTLAGSTIVVESSDSAGAHYVKSQTPAEPL